MRSNTADVDVSRKALDLFQAAVKLGRDERGTFLAAIDDPGLRAEVDKLLAVDELAPEQQSTDVLHAAVEVEAAALCSSGDDSQTPPRIGPYRLFRRLGEGGMGEVWLAGRTDFKYQVTVKLIKNGLDNEGILRRFEYERQILAGLDHPHIARLLDGGTTDDGLPYFVMEYVQGEPIDRYCDHHGLSIDARLQLFRKVCSAVQYAHLNLVVHRDLKPGNILVTAKGEPKLLDFGVAKMLKPELFDQTVQLTDRDRMRFMTVAYASPEQFRDQPITAASDVYSLGVLLYELLAGHRPYRLAGKSLQEIEQVICETDPERPSTSSEVADGGAAEPGDRREIWRRKLAGDLDNIVLKAMRKEPRRRYSSVDELSEDLRNYLRGMPVIARPSTFAYRAGKFVRRNKLLVAFVAVLLAFAVGMTALWFRVLEERDAALRERATSQQALSFLMDSFELADPSEARGETISARAILDRGAQRIDRELGGQPEARAALKQTMGRVYAGLGLYDRAAEVLEEALEIRIRALGENRLEIAESQHHLAQVLLDKGDLQQAEQLFRRSLELRRELVGEQHPQVAASWQGLAAVLLAHGDHQRAEPLFRRALTSRRRLYGTNHVDVAESLHGLAIIRRKTGELAAAEDLLREALRIYRELNGESHPATLQVMSNLAGLLKEKGDNRAAEPFHRRVLELRIEILGEDHPAVAGSLHNLAAVLRDLGEYEEARALLDEALDLWRRTLGEGHHYIGIGLINLAELQLATGELARAELELREALDILSSAALPPDNWWIYRARNTLGACLTGLGRLVEAEAELLASLPVLRDQTGERSPYTRTALQRLVDLYDAWEKPEEAAAYRALLEKVEHRQPEPEP